MGDSTPFSYDSISHWAYDVEEFCDANEIETFNVVGLSGGGPYALACAHALPERIQDGVAILGGVAPTAGPEAATGGLTKPTRIFSPILQVFRAPLNVAMRGLIRLLEPHADQVIEFAASMMPPGDQKLFADPATRQRFIEDLGDGSCDQMQAIVLDGRLFGRDWGFSLRNISVPVHLWYGDADKIVPVSHGKHIASLIPDSAFRTRHDEGHLGGLGAFEEVLDALQNHTPASKVRTTRGTKKRARKKTATARKIKMSASTQASQS